MNTGEKIKAARKAQGFSQQQLGGEDFTKGYISQLEKGYVNPSMKVLRLISERLKMPISYFLEDANSPSNELQDKFIFAENCLNQELYNKAIDAFNSLINLCNDKKSSLSTLSLLNIGKAMLAKQSYKEGIDYLNSAIANLKTLTSFEKLVEAYKLLGDCFFNLSEYITAIEVYSNGLSCITANKLKLIDLEAKLLLNLASAYSNIGNYKIAKEYFEKNIKFCKDKYVADTLLDSCVRLAYCHYELEEYELSKAYLSKANGINAVLGSEIVASELYSQEALLAAKLKKYVEIFELLTKSFELASNLKYEFGYNLNIVYWTEILIAYEKYETAEKYALKYLDKLNKSSNKLPLYLLKGHLGQLLIKKGEIEIGKAHLETSIEGLISLNLYGDVHKNSKLLAALLIYTHPEIAAKYYDLSIKYR